VSVTTDSELHVAGNLDLNHGGLVVYELLNRDDDLVDVFPVDLLTRLETFNHIIDELLCHLVA
jgi:hypothetical protein